MRHHAAARPFTLIELIMVMSVMVLLAAVAIPAYSSLFSGRKTTLAANKLNSAIMEARSHAVSAKIYTAILFVKDGDGYKSFRLAEVYYNPENSTYNWRRWVPGASIVALPENTMIPIPVSGPNKELGVVSGESASTQNTAVAGGSAPPKVTNLTNSGISGTNTPAIIFKPNGQLAGTDDSNMVVRFVEINRFQSAPNKTPRLPLNINWLTCKTKFMDPVEPNSTANQSQP